MDGFIIGAYFVITLLLIIFNPLVGIGLALFGIMFVLINR